MIKKMVLKMGYVHVALTTYIYIYIVWVWAFPPNPTVVVGVP